MSLRIGRTPPRPSRTLPGIPPNRGMSQIANAKLAALTPVAMQRLRQAILTDGYPTRVWVRKFQGHALPCSCRTSVTVPTVHVPTGQPLAVPPDLDSPIEDDTRTPVFVDPSLDTVAPDWFTGHEEADNFTVNPPSPYTTSNPLPETDPRSSVNELNAEHPTTPVVTAPVTDEWDDTFKSLFPWLNEAQPCGICGGTGHVDMYRYASGLRFVFRVGDAMTDMDGVTIDTSTRPYSFLMERSSAFVEWVWYIPPYFEAVEAIRVRNSVDTVAVGLECYSGSGWQPLTADVVASLRGTGGSLRCRAVMDEAERWTHVELLLRTADLFACQFPQLPRDVGGDAIEALIQTQFNLDPLAGFLSRGTIIESPRHGRLFLVTSVTNHQNSNGDLWQVSGQVRIVQPMEALHRAFTLSPWNPPT